MDPGIPVPVGYTVALSAETGWLVFGNYTTIVIGICVGIITVVAVETPEIQAMGKKHILVSTEGKM